MLIDKHAPNTFCWPELTSTASAAARTFYAALFGWAANDNPVPGGGTYTIFSLKGRNVAATSQMRSDELAAGVPSHWNCYVAVDSADESGARVVAAGGKIIVPPFDVMDVGRMAVYADPWGAAFSLWQPKQHIGSQIVDEIGAPSWYELMTSDVEGAKRFYGSVFGWRGETYGDSGYTEFYLGREAVAGMLARTANMAHVPPMWSVYFDVANVDASVAHARTLGGRVLVPAQDIPDVGRFAALADPTGASFCLLRLIDHDKMDSAAKAKTAQPKVPQAPASKATEKKAAKKTVTKAPKKRPGKKVKSKATRKPVKVKKRKSKKRKGKKRTAAGRKAKTRAKRPSRKRARR